MLIESPLPTFITPVIKSNQQGSEQLGGRGDRKEDGYATDSKKREKHVFAKPPHSLIKNNFIMYSFYLRKLHFMMEKCHSENFRGHLFTLETIFKKN